MSTTQTQPQFDETLCTLCGLCVAACTCRAVELGDQGPVFTCLEIGSVLDGQAGDCDCLCEEVCPTAAISWAFEIVLEADTSAGTGSIEPAGSNPRTDPDSAVRGQEGQAEGGRKE
jgi:ferredoxin